MEALLEFIRFHGIMMNIRYVVDASGWAVTFESNRDQIKRGPRRVEESFAGTVEEALLLAIMAHVSECWGGHDKGVITSTATMFGAWSQVTWTKTTWCE